MLLKVSGAGQSVELNVPEDATVGAIKLAIETECGIAPCYQKLICCGKPLKDDEASAASFGVLDRTKIILMKSPEFTRDEAALSAIDAIKTEIDALETCGDRGSPAVVERCTQLCCKLDAVEVGDSARVRQVRKAQLARCDVLSQS